MQCQGFLSAPNENRPMTHSPGDIRKGKRGNLPFALVAVALLIGASAYCAAAAEARDADRRNENTGTETDTVSAAVSGIEGFIERGMGENVFSVSTNMSLGDMTQRTETFGKRMDRWMETMFPAVDSGVKVTVHSYDIGLSVENLRISSGYYAADGYIPAYLKAEGTVDATFESESGSARKTLYVSSDASGALPLAAEAGTAFESILEDGGSVLSQMVSYQLTALAQYRIMNGYGAFAYYGEYGTESVLTGDDVKEAYSRALRAAESIVFRDADGGIIAGRADLAKEVVGCTDGVMEINVGAIYSQALASVADQIVGKWFDYFLGNKVLQICDYVTDTLKNAWDSLTSFITGRNSFSAEPYIKEIVGDTDIGVGEYMEVSLTMGDGKTRTLNLKYPEHDLMGSDTVGSFKSHYRDDTNEIRQWLYSVVNEAISQVAEKDYIGTVRVNVDNTAAFADLLSGAVRNAMEKSEAAFVSAALDAVSWHSYPDQFYAAIYDAVYRDREKILNTDFDNFVDMNYDTVSDFLSDCYRDMDISDEEFQETHDANVDAILYSKQVKTQFDAYTAKVDALLKKMESLKSVQTEGSTIIEKGCIGILKGGMLLADGAFDVSDHLNQVCYAFAENIGINATKTLRFSGKTSFALAGEHGATENLKVKVSSDPKVSVDKPSASDSTHQNGIEDSAGANYSTVFPVHLEDTLTYTVRGYGPMSELLGAADCEFGGTVPVSMDLNICAVSGWSLAGVEYEATSDILQDLWKTLLKAAEPLLDPLRGLLALAGKTANALREVIDEVVRYAAPYMEELYEKIVRPLSSFISTVMLKIDDVLGERVYEAANGLCTIVDMTMKTQTVGFSYMGFALTFTTDCSSLSKSTKNLIRVDMSGNVGGDDISAYLKLVLRETSPKTVVTGGITIKGDGWEVSGTVDPTMTQTEHLFTLEGTFKGTDVELAVPELVQYREMNLALSDIPAVGTVLSNLPSPVAGTKLSVDAGLDIKYSAPFETGVLINEVESNPRGLDFGDEWAEILNNTAGTVDISGWKLKNSDRRTFTVPDGTILAPGERYIAEFSGLFLDNSGERLTLYDTDGKCRDRTPEFSDRSNDSNTYQRETDGYTGWGFHEESPGESNTGGILGKDGIVISTAADILKDAAVKAMKELKHVTDTAGAGELFSLTMQYALDDGIDRMADFLVEASVYIEAEIADLTGTECTGFRIYVSAGKEMAGDILRYLVGRAESMFLDIEDPYGVDLGTAVSDDIYLGVTAYTGIRPPSSIAEHKGIDSLTAAIDMQCNISALKSVLGDGGGTWNVRAGIVIRGCPYNAIPDSLDADDSMDSDLWLIRASFSPSGT